MKTESRFAVLRVRPSLAGRRAVMAALSSGDTDYSFKVVIIGDAGVGKTALVQRYVSDRFLTGICPTIGELAYVAPCIHELVEERDWKRHR